MECYLHFAKHPDFVQAVIRDGRSFDSARFKTVIEYIKQTDLTTLVYLPPLTPPLSLTSLLPFLYRQSNIKRFERFILDAIALKEKEKADEAELGDVPDEFLGKYNTLSTPSQTSTLSLSLTHTNSDRSIIDPITCETMSDPVLLPSGHTVDRATITRHLLSDSTNPFNRAHLTVDMLKPSESLSLLLFSLSA